MAENKTGDVRDIGPDGKARLRLERTFKAAPDAVYRAWTEAETLKRWFSPSASIPVVADADVRVGGRYRIQMRMPSGDDNIAMGEYQEIIPGRRLVFTFHWISTPDRVSLVTLDISPSGTGSRLVFTQERFFDAAARDRHAGGWTSMFDQFDARIST